MDDGLNERLSKLRASGNNLLNAIDQSSEKAKVTLSFLQAMFCQVQLHFQNYQNPYIYSTDNDNQFSNHNVKYKEMEKQRIHERLRGFNVKSNFVVEELTRRFGSDVKQGELVDVALAISEKADIRLDRDAKRRKAVLFKWFEENWQTIQPYLDYIIIEDPPENEDSKIVEPNDEKTKNNQ